MTCVTRSACMRSWPECYCVADRIATERTAFQATEPRKKKTRMTKIFADLKLFLWAFLIRGNLCHPRSSFLIVETSSCVGRPGVIFDSLVSQDQTDLCVLWLPLPWFRWLRVTLDVRPVIERAGRTAARNLCNPHGPRTASGPEGSSAKRRQGCAQALRAAVRPVNPSIGCPSVLPSSRPQVAPSAI
jgi:hypothetical protein